MLARRVLIGALGAATLVCAMDSMAGGAVEANDSNVLSGFYLGANLGYGKTNETLENNSTKNKGFVWGADAGYNFNQYLAVEAGYTQMATVKVSGQTLSSENRMFDLVAKGTYPINTQFNIFGKLGAAYTHTKLASTIGGASIEGAGANGAIVPYFGAGVGYNLTKNVSFNVQGFATTKRANVVPAMYGATAGVAYTF